MSHLINAFPLYQFLKYCNGSPLEKVILDCGAGGSNPPLSLFHEFGYKTFGIDVSEEQVAKAEVFCRQKHMDLNIVEGDMTHLCFDDDSFSFLFSYNTTVHMKKTDFRQAMQEFARVLRTEGLCYINFLNEECDTYGIGAEVSPGEFLQIDNGEKVQFTHYRRAELDNLLHGFDILYEEKRTVSRSIEGKKHISGYYDFILRKA